MEAFTELGIVRLSARGEHGHGIVSASEERVINAVACQETNRQFIGFEISEKWCKVANDRLNKTDANGQTCMFLR